jgi:hypothetical protein
MTYGAPMNRRQSPAAERRSIPVVLRQNSATLNFRPRNNATRLTALLIQTDLPFGEGQAFWEIGAGAAIQQHHTSSKRTSDPGSLPVNPIGQTELQADIYAVAALAAGGVVVIGYVLHYPAFLMMTVGALLYFWLRVMAIYRGWHLPIARWQNQLD